MKIIVNVYPAKKKLIEKNKTNLLQLDLFNLRGGNRTPFRASELYKTESNVRSSVLLPRLFNLNIKNMKYEICKHPHSI